ncbi:VWA domain-containing protein [Aurantibacter sp.]|uniref:VWA domain-containing protein n=1 Tax=Aurantibacter sp. TaxID=2807103 RepID=UPI0035C8416D
MNTQTYFYIILAGIASLLVALFLYKYKSKSALKKNALFAFLRFLSVFLILILLINPKITNTSYYNEKPNLVVVTDNSNSIKQLKEEENVKVFLNSIEKNKELSERFNILNYTFSDELGTDSLNFKNKQTNISKALLELKSIYKETVSPTILITDGNQTYGSDYTFAAQQYQQPIYPIVVGDSLKTSDLKISNLNVNKYAYLKNKFPVEVILVYNGDNTITKNFSITSNGKAVFSKAINFTKDNNSQILRFELPTNKVGVQTYSASLGTLENEKNKQNNYKKFAIEVIDKSTNVAIVSTLLHPDLGALKKSIETNKQRKVSILKPKKFLNQKNDFQMVMLYQPNNQFKSILSYLTKENINYLAVLGTQTNFDFLNKETDLFSVEATSQTENYQPIFNSNYNAFITPELDFNSFPPLKSIFGELKINSEFQTLLEQSVNGISTNQPLLATLEKGTSRYGILFGENIWKWRAQSYVNQQTFTVFDDFTGKLVQFLASKKRKQRITLDYQTFYDGNANAVLRSQVFNKNYEFDASQSVNIILKDEINNNTINLPLILSNNSYQVDLSQLKPSKYSFTVSTNSNLAKSGSFEILDFNIEAQFANADVTKLHQLSTNSNGVLGLIDNYQVVLDNLLNDKRYLPIQKSTTKTEALINCYYLLFLIVLIIVIEWYLRKYKGLI